jgi:transcription factor WhiB
MRRCPVAGDCLEFAIDHPAESSDEIWGGTTPNERRAIRKQLRAAASFSSSPRSQGTSLKSRARGLPLPTQKPVRSFT